MLHPDENGTYYLLQNSSGSGICYFHEKYGVPKHFQEETKRSLSNLTKNTFFYFFVYTLLKVSIYIIEQKTIFLAASMSYIF